MIYLLTHSGQIIKSLSFDNKLQLVFHKKFGFLSSENLKRRLQLRKKTGYLDSSAHWNFALDLIVDGQQLKVASTHLCEAAKVDKDRWKIIFNSEIYYLSSKPLQLPDYIGEQRREDDTFLERVVGVLILSAMIIGTLMYFLNPQKVEELQEELAKPITVTVITPPKTVNIAQEKSHVETKPVVQQKTAKSAAMQNLGFLKIAGRKDLTKAVGGLPTELKKVTAGAGAGGDAGSGGEVIAGLGRGVKRTTVGNTGVAGLGGIGTKGAGGGLGGYGDSSVASGNGAGISAIALSDNMILEGGLDRYVIKATIAKYINQVRRCYEDGLRTKDDLEGVVHVAFQISGQGRLNFSKVKKSTLGNKNVETCITNKMMNWIFPKPNGGVNVDVTYPFVLRPVKS